MASLISLILLSSWAALGLTFPHSVLENTRRGSRVELESSGGGSDEPVQGIVKVVQLDPHTLAQSGLLRRGPTPRRAPSLSSRLSFPVFLSRGRPGPAPILKGPVNPLNYLYSKPTFEEELKKKQGLQMWQRAVDKGDKGAVSLPISLKDTKQTCTAVPFTQRVTADGCETVTVYNNLCFGQCNSLFIPSEGEFARSGAGMGPHRRTPCSRCAPSKTHTVTVPLRCGAETRQKRMMVVEECKCETGREERTAVASTYKTT